MGGVIEVSHGVRGIRMESKLQSELAALRLRQKLLGFNLQGSRHRDVKGVCSEKVLRVPLE
jgi:hypothetical protein